MLEIRNLTKTYRSKTGQEVRALDNVSITFPETGMVFILGKSGSGKSTLLNIMGGLDSYDAGEFIIKGKSSQDFAGSDFDAYRNTFIGFIFQEYNVLDDFTVGANIALALELQGKKAEPETIGGILAQVDLTDFAKRKPNELSGGQKQRVAIARALVKDPQIIMADEPTGALDSNTGKQIFDTLKKLSETKLVLIVSHDRDFAERYADRIVELADGKILSDVTKHEHESETLSAGVDKLSGQILRIKAGYTLTPEDVRMINEYLAKGTADVLLSGDGRVNEELRAAAGISEKGTTAVFEDTDGEKDYKLKKYEKKDSHFIRSRLPMKNAVRMGASGLKHKKFRLVMTVFLSLIAFALFGFADTLAAYEKFDAAVNSVVDSNVKNASVTLGIRRTMSYADGDVYISYMNEGLNDADILYLKEQTGLPFIPVFTGEVGGYGNGGFSLSGQMHSYSADSALYTARLSGLAAMDQQMLDTLGFSIRGRLPESEGEIAITDHLYRQFNEYGFRNSDKGESINAGSVTAEENGENSVIGKHISFETYGKYGMVMQTYKIVGVVDTQFDYERYSAFLPEDDSTPVLPEEEGNALTDMVLQMELKSELDYGFHALGFMTSKDIATISANFTMSFKELSTYMDAWNSSMHLRVLFGEDGEDGKEKFYTIGSVADSNVLSSIDITWLDGQVKTQLGENEILLPMEIFNQMVPSMVDVTVDMDALRVRVDALYGDGAWAQTSSEKDLMSRISQAAAKYYNSDEYTVQSNVYEDFLPLIASLYGVQTFASDAILNAFEWYQRLYDVYESSPTVSLGRADIERLLFELAAVEATDAGELWKNDTFVKLALIYTGFTEDDWNALPENDRRIYTIQCYRDWYLYDGGAVQNMYGATGTELSAMAMTAFLDKNGPVSASGLSFELYENNYMDDHEISLGTRSYTVVGFFENTSFGPTFVISDALYNEYQSWAAEDMGEYGYREEYEPHTAGIWSYALAPLGTDRAVIEKLVGMTYDEDAGLLFQLQNPVMDTLDTFNDFIEVGSQVFLWVGVGFAVFSALLLMNFIATSISYKKREIGVLRAVGARSSDVFKIFFSEAFMIALINFILSTVAVVIAIIVVNTLMRDNGISITLLHYGVRQFVLMFFVSSVVALLASFLPVYKIAKKKPVDAIKDR